MNQFAVWIVSIFNLNAVLLRDSAEFIAFTVKGSMDYCNASSCLLLRECCSVSKLIQENR